jgi:hypothetical protein
MALAFAAACCNAARSSIAGVKRSRSGSGCDAAFTFGKEA